MPLVPVAATSGNFCRLVASLSFVFEPAAAYTMCPDPPPSGYVHVTTMGTCVFLLGNIISLVDVTILSVNSPGGFDA
eukprot:gene3084-1688_t